MSDLPSPLTPAGSDLRDFPYTPIFRTRLFGSSFHALADDSEWRAGVTLWMKSWDQVPAGSLPDDDVQLCRLAELARDLKAWKKIKPGAMRGWLLCADGRLYHPVVAEGVNHAVKEKSAQRRQTANARIAMLRKRLTQATTEAEREQLSEEIHRVQQSLSQTLSQGLSQTMQQPPREGKDKEKGEGTTSSAPIGAVGPADVIALAAGIQAGTQDLTDAEEKLLWNAALALVIPSYSTGTEKAKDAKARSFIGGLGKKLKHAGVDRRALFDVIQAACVERPVNPESWLAAAVATRVGNRKAPNKQEALEQSNRAVADEWMRKQGIDPVTGNPLVADAEIVEAE